MVSDRFVFSFTLLHLEAGFLATSLSHTITHIACYTPALIRPQCGCRGFSTFFCYVTEINKVKLVPFGNTVTMFKQKTESCAVHQHMLKLLKPCCTTVLGTQDTLLNLTLFYANLK